MAQSYSIIKMIGNGIHGKVFLAQSLQTVAIKQPFQKDCDEFQQEKIILEMIQKQGTISGIPQLIDSIEIDEFPSLVLEYVEGEYLTDLEHEQALVDIIDYITQLITILAKLHSYNIAHNDLTVCNILLSNRKKINIIDFGRSTVLSDLRDTSNFFLDDILAALSHCKQWIYWLVADTANKQAIYDWLENAYCDEKRWENKNASSLLLQWQALSPHHFS